MELKVVVVVVVKSIVNSDTLVSVDLDVTSSSVVDDD